MSNKNKVKKPNRPKKRVSPSLIAEVVGCSGSLVRQVISGDRSNETSMGQRIEIADMLLEEGLNKLVTEVKRVVKI